MASNLQPQSTVLVEQVLETTSQSAGTQSVAQQQYGYYPNPSYVTLTPVTFTTSLPEVGDSVQPYTYYHIGAKFWYLPLYFMFAFVVFYGYMIIANAAFRKWQFSEVKVSSRRERIMEATEQVLSAIEKAVEMIG